MTIVNKLFYIILLLTIFTIEPLILYAKSPKSILKELTKRYNKIETLKADFKEVYEWAHTGEKIQRTGQILLAQGQRFRLDTEDQLIVCDNESVFRHNKIKSQVIIEPIDNSADILLPRKLLLNFSNEFKAKKLMELPVNNNLGYRIDLNANKPDEMLISTATLWVTAEDKTIRRMRFVDLNGNITTYYLSNIMFNESIDSTITSFEIPLDVELFDLR